MTLTKEMIDITSLLTKKLAELSSNRLDTPTLDTFFEYINARIRQAGELYSFNQNHSISRTKENIGE